MVNLTILGHFGPVHFPTALRRLLNSCWYDHEGWLGLQRLGESEIVRTDVARTEERNSHRPGTIKFSGELRKAVAVSEEKIQQRSRRRGRFSSSHFPCRKMPKPWQGQHFVLPENRGRISSSVESCRKTFPAENFGQPQPSREGLLRRKQHNERN